MTEKQIKFISNYILKSILTSLILTLLFFLPIFFLLRILRIYSHYPEIDLILISIAYWTAIFITFLSPLKNIYDYFLENIKQENSNQSQQKRSFIKLCKLAIKQGFCKHSGYVSQIEENPSPLCFFSIRAKCKDCGIENHEIRERAVLDYKIELANDLLFQRNIEKFSDFYKDKAQQMNLNRGK